MESMNSNRNNGKMDTEHEVSVTDAGRVFCANVGMMSAVIVATITLVGPIAAGAGILVLAAVGATIAACKHLNAENGESA